MKKLGVIVVVAAFAIFAVANLVHGFITNDPIHYFTEQPHRLLLVAAIAVVGGLATLLFYRLSPAWQRSVKLFSLGLVASCLTAFTGYMLYVLARCASQVGISNSPLYFIVMPVCFGIVTAMLWFEFYRVSKKRVV